MQPYAYTNIHTCMYAYIHTLMYTYHVELVAQRGHCYLEMAFRLSYMEA
jgi:hypothetical protein